MEIRTVTLDTEPDFSTSYGIYLAFQNIRQYHDFILIKYFHQSSSTIDLIVLQQNHTANFLWKMLILDYTDDKFQKEIPTAIRVLGNLADKFESASFQFERENPIYAQEVLRIAKRLRRIQTAIRRFNISTYTPNSASSSSTSNNSSGSSSSGSSSGSNSSSSSSSNNIGHQISQLIGICF
jgi:uncharacterized membrane protein YgcG